MAALLETSVRQGAVLGTSTYHVDIINDQRLPRDLFRQLLPEDAIVVLTHADLHSSNILVSL